MQIIEADLYTLKVSLDCAFNDLQKRIFDTEYHPLCVMRNFSVKSIGKNAFQNCSKLENVEFSEGLKNVGRDAFKGCSSLGSVTLPSTIKKLGYID